MSGQPISTQPPASKRFQASDLKGFMRQLWTAGVPLPWLGQHAEVGFAGNAPLVGGAVLQQAAGCRPGWGYQPLKQFLHTASPDMLHPDVVCHSLSQWRSVDKPTVQVSRSRQQASQLKECAASSGSRRGADSIPPATPETQQQAHGLWHTSTSPGSEVLRHCRCTPASHACPLP